MGEGLRIRIEGLNYCYPGGQEALSGVSLAIDAGQQVLLLGPNGAGKTTLAKHLNGLLRATHGRVWIGDRSVGDSTVGQMASLVGYVFQYPEEQLFKSTVAEELAFGPRNLGYPEERIQKLVADEMLELGLEGLAQAHPYDLTPPQQRLVAIASVLAMETPIIVLDEPTTGLDPWAVAKLGRVMARLGQNGKTVILISQDVDFGTEHCDRAIVMVGGQIVMDGGKEEVFSREAELAQVGIGLPQITTLGLRLGLPRLVFTEEDFIEAYRQVWPADIR